MSTEWLTVEDIASNLRVNEGTVRSWIRNKKLKAAKFGRDYRIRRIDYEKFIQEHFDLEDQSPKE